MVTCESQVIQVTNLAPQATRDQMQTLFNFFGKIDDLRLYPTNRDISSNPVLSRICFIKFHGSDAIPGALHLTNTVFIDRALIVVVAAKNDIPEEAEAMSILQKEVIFPLTQTLPDASDSEKDTEDQNEQGEGEDGKKAAVTKRKKLPPYPQLLASYDIRKIEIIRRTVLVYDYDPEVASPKELIDYFCTVAEVKQMRMCHKANEPNKLYALVEFSEQSGIVAAFKLNGSLLNGFKIRLMHSTQAIVAPIPKPTDQTEIEETMKRLKEAQTLIANTLDPFGSILGGGTVVSAGIKDEEKQRSRSRSRSKSHGRSRVRSKSKPKSKSRSKSRKKSVASRSRSKSRSRRRKSRSRSRHSRRRRSRSPRRHGRSPSRSRVRRVRSSRSRSRSKPRKRSRSRSRSHRRSHRRHRSPTPEKISNSSSSSRHKTKSSTTSKRSRSRSRSKTRSGSKVRSGSHSKDEKKSSHHHRHSKSSRRSKSRSRSHTKSRPKSDSKHKSSRKTSPKPPKPPKSPSTPHSNGDKPEVKNEAKPMEVDSHNATNGKTNGTADANIEMKSEA